MDKRKGMGKDKEFAFTGILEKLFCKNKKKKGGVQKSLTVCQRI